MTTSPSQPAIRATRLRKSFGDQVVLDGIDLDVPGGTIFALLGPTGPSRATTVHILSTLIGADGGQAQVAGHDVARDPDPVRAAIGVTGQLTAVDNLLTGEENLLLMADLRHLGRPTAGGGRPSCWSGSTWPRRPGNRSRPGPGACGAASTWPWAWSATRGSSSWTSPPPAGPAQPPHHVADDPRPGGR